MRLLNCTRTGVLAFLFAVFIFSHARAQEEQKWFGQNKVQYRDYHWKYVQSEHFDVYFYEGGDDLAKFTADVAESSYVTIIQDFKNYDIQNRVSIVVYNSHNHFQQTNVLDEYLYEGIGGVTELFKNRVVLPFEGSFDQFRHVIHHELVHAVMNDYMYGGSIQGLISGRIRVQIPGWVAEGLAEYESRYDEFDTQSDMFVRDAVVEGYLPTISQLDGYPVYTAGPTIFKYMEEKYGKEKVGEFMTKLRVAGTTNSTFESTFGMKEEEFSEKWAMYQRKTYYPDISDMQSVKEIGNQLTHHERDGNFYNMTPTLSPNGDKIAYLTDRSGYAGIELISPIDGKLIKTLVSGEKSGSLEELHWLSPGMSWSPDSKKLAFSAKASDNDALLVVDVQTGAISKYGWKDLEGVFGGSWSPDGHKIVFTGMVHGQSDIYVFDLEKNEKHKITDDIFSDTRPLFSRDGNKIVFVSDRRDYLGKPPADFKMVNYAYKQTDIYVMNSDGSGMERITTDEMNDTWPEWGPDNSKLLFTSNRNGVTNLYIADLQAKKNYAITNNLSGIFQPSLSKDGKIAVYTGFNRNGFDVFTLKNPFEMKPLELPLTISMKKFRKEKDLPTTLADEIGITKKTDNVSKQESAAAKMVTDSSTVVDSTRLKLKETAAVSYQNFIFAGLDEKKDTAARKTEEEIETVVLPERVYKNDKGDYRVRNYRVRFTPDLVYGSAGYNTFIGFQGTTQLAFSDILGDHRLQFGTNLFFDLKNSSFYGSYYYLAKQTDYGISAFHTAYSFATDYVVEPSPGFAFPGSDGFADSFVRFRYYGIGLSASRPINKFNRFDLSVTQFTLARETTLDNAIQNLITGFDSLGQPITIHATKENVGLGNSRSSNNTIISAAFTTDNALNTYFGPFDGHRAQIAVTASPGYGKSGLRFATVTADFRKYFWFQKYYAVAMRASGGATYGRNPQRFFVGGLDNWIVPRFTNGDILVNTFEDFLATFVSPIRGSDYYELQGTRYVVANFEFRFPLIHFMQLGFPLPLFFQSIRGVTFIDMGLAWGGRDQQFIDPNNGSTHLATYRYIDRQGNIIYNRSKFNLTQKLPGEAGRVFQDARIGYGFGIRAFVGFFILRYDLAWNIRNPRFQGSDVKHYFSIGSDF